MFTYGTLRNIFQRQFASRKGRDTADGLGEAAGIWEIIQQPYGFDVAVVHIIAQQGRRVAIYEFE